MNESADCVEVMFVRKCEISLSFAFQCRFYSRKKDAEKESVIPKNVLEKLHTAHFQPNGPIIDNKPFKLSLKASE